MPVAMVIIRDGSVSKFLDCQGASAKEYGIKGKYFLQICTEICDLLLIFMFIFHYMCCKRDEVSALIYETMVVLLKEITKKSPNLQTDFRFISNILVFLLIVCVNKQDVGGKISVKFQEKALDTN